MAEHKIEPGQIGSYGNSLTSETVDTVKVEGPCQSVKVTNLTGTKAIYVTVNGVAPTNKGAATYEVPPIAGASLKIGTAVVAGEIDLVKLIAAGTPEYSVARSQQLPQA